MKFIHLSDLHIGKRINEFSMIKDQMFIIEQIIDIIKKEKVGAVIISGDVYDKSIPPVEAVGVFDEFLTELSIMGIPTVIISGNHDSPERIGFGSGIMKNNGIHIYSVFDGTMHNVKIDNVNFHMLPFIKPIVVRRFYPDVDTYEDALRSVIENSSINKLEKNVILSHQFVTAMGKETKRSDSESISLGGLDNIDVSVFDCFDYTALGHIHRPQSIRKNVRYCGSPLKYSFSESPYEKSVTIVDSNDFSVKTIPLIPLHDMRMIKGDMENILSKEVASLADCNDYVHITLTDKDNIIDVMDKVRNVYPNVMQLEFEKNNSVNEPSVYEAVGVESKSPQELFLDFYEIQNEMSMDDEKLKLLSKFMEEAKEV